MKAGITAEKQRGRPFERGVSGNPAGRPRGARNRASMMAEALTDRDAVAIARAVVAKAKNGDMVAARLVLDRVWPAARGRALKLDLPSVMDAASLVTAHAMLVAAVADGSVTGEEGTSLGALLTQQLKLIESADLERRLQALEELQAQRPHG
jgi:uncharacterized protein DUF5681